MVFPMWREAGIHEAFFEPTSVTCTTHVGRRHREGLRDLGEVARVLRA